MKILNLVGQKFGKLQVVERLPNYISPSGQSVVFFLCKCECGKYHKVRSIHLRRGKIQSCGNCDDRLHGESGTRLYNLWNNMRFRTTDKYFQRKFYFDKGIVVCDDWQDYKKFAEWARNNGYEEGLQLDRINNSKGYEPDNCRWVSTQTNTNNRDVTFKVKYKGDVYAFTDLVDAKKLRKHEATIRQRIRNGWTIEDAFDKPFREGKYRRK